MADGTMTGIEVKRGFFPLAWLLFLCTPRVDIDGQVEKKSWGKHFFEVAPGQHTVTVYFAYLFITQCGKNSVTVNVESGSVAHVSFYMPPLMFAKGAMKVS
jgi:hypothetical protein